MSHYTCRRRRRLTSPPSLASPSQRLGLDTELPKLSVIHVAGTKGKGSTCAMIERMLREAGYRTGLFTSPHLIDVRERIRINGWVGGCQVGVRRVSVGVGQRTKVHKLQLQVQCCACRSACVPCSCATPHLTLPSPPSVHPSPQRARRPRRVPAQPVVVL